MKACEFLTIYNFIVDDFEAAWDGLAANKSEKGRGNFLFARQAMTLLEFAARLCKSNDGKAKSDSIKKLSDALFTIEKRYFTELPKLCVKNKDFTLPYHQHAEKELLWALFDLIRHGGAHQYRQIFVNLKDKTQWVIDITGVVYGKPLSTVKTEGRPQEHLGYYKDGPIIKTRVYPE